MKYQSNSTLDCCKGRLVAQGYTQTYDIDYEDIFAPVTKLNTSRIILSLATHCGWELQKFELK